MKVNTHPIIAILAMGLFVSLPAMADGILHARVSFESGGALVQGATDDDWSFATINSLILPGDDIWVDNEGLMELEFAGGTFVRAADQSRLRITEVPPQAVLEGTTGSFYVQRISRSTGSVLFKTPAADIVIDQDSHVRIDVVGQGATTVTVRWGEARVLSSVASPTAIRAGQRVYIDPGLLPSAPVSFNRNEMDAFDTWSAERARNLALGETALPTSVTVTPTTLGYRELATQGTWVHVDNTPYWRPTVVVDYVPYRYGHWSYSQAYGYSWVGNHSFSYVTSHYGRWRHHPSHGWIWTYRDTWAPAWVFSARYGSNYVWAPLDPWDRPVSYGSAFFSIGSHRISVYASSYAPVSGLYYGPVAVRPWTPTHVTNINVTQINIWNIYDGGSNYTRSPRYSRGHLDRFADSVLTMRDFHPRRSIRGPEVDSRTNLVARAITTRLEERTRASSIEQGRSVPVRSIRTAQGASRSAEVRQTTISTDRSVRVTQDDSVRERRATAESAAAARSTTTPDRSVRGFSHPESQTRSVRETRSTEPAATTPDRGVRAPSAGERPVTSRSAPSVESRSVDSARTRPDATTRVAPDARTREVTAAPPSARGGRTVDSISTTPGTRSGAADGTRGVRGSTLPTARGGAESRTAPPAATTPSRAPAARSSEPATTRQPSPQIQSRQPSPQIQSRQPAAPRTQTPTRQPAPQAQTPTRQQAPQVQTRQPSPQIQSRQPAPQPQPRSQAPQIQSRQPSPQIQSRQPAPQPQPRSQAPQIQSRQPSPQIQSRQPAPQLQPRSQAPQIQSRQPSPQIQSRQSAPRPQSRSFSAPSPQQRSISAPSRQPAPQQRSISTPGARGTSSRGR